MTPVTRLLVALLLAALVVGGLSWWLAWPPAPEPPAPAARDGAATERAQRIRELRRELEAHREAIAAARSRRADAGDELERLREALVETRGEVERLEARTGDGGAD